MQAVEIKPENSSKKKLRAIRRSCNQTEGEKEGERGRETGREIERELKTARLTGRLTRQSNYTNQLSMIADRPKKTITVLSAHGLVISSACFRQEDG